MIESETGSGKCAVIRSTRNDRSDYSGTTELYRTVSLNVPNSTAIFCDFLIFLKRGKKKRVGSKIVGRVGLPEPHNFFVYVCLCYEILPILCSLVITRWERADLLALLFAMFSCVFVTSPYSVQDQVWYLFVSISDLPVLLYLHWLFEP